LSFAIIISAPISAFIVKKIESKRIRDLVGMLEEGGWGQ